LCVFGGWSCFYFIHKALQLHSIECLGEYGCAIFHLLKRNSDFCCYSVHLFHDFDGIQIDAMELYYEFAGVLLFCIRIMSNFSKSLELHERRLIVGWWLRSICSWLWNYNYGGFFPLVGKIIVLRYGIEQCTDISYSTIW